MDIEDQVEARAKEIVQECYPDIVKLILKELDENGVEFIFYYPVEGGYSKLSLENGEALYILRHGREKFLAKHYGATIDDVRLLTKKDLTPAERERVSRLWFSNPYPRSEEKATEQKTGHSGYVYLMQSGQYHKIGCSADPDKRRDHLGTKPPFEVEIVCTIPTDDMYGLEKKLHERFEDKRVNGEWFELDPDDVEHIEKLNNRE